MNAVSQRNSRYYLNPETWLAILCLAQPILDVLSYWLGKIPHGNTISLGLRMVILALTILYAWIISVNKKPYIIVISVLSVFWLCHVVTCCFVGYQSPVSDFINYARTAQIPLMTLCLISIMKQSDHPLHLLERLLTATLYLIAVITLIAVLTGTTVYSYPWWKVGYSGWFGWTNSQSAIYGVLTAVAVCSALEHRCWIRAALRGAIGFALLFFLGTRLAYAEIFAIALFAPLCMVITRRFDWRCTAALLSLAILCAVFYHSSPMAVNRRMYAESVVRQQTQVDNSQNALSLDELYAKYLPSLTDRFGLEAVEEAFDYTRDVSVIGNIRTSRLLYCHLAMKELPFASRLFGFELETTVYRGDIFDVENDYHGIYYLYGIVGLALLCAFILAFIWRALVRSLQKPEQYLTFSLAGYALATALLLGNVVFSASVLRRPNASFYLSLMLAALWYLTDQSEKRQA